MTNEICHIEIAAGDLAVAEGFYHSLFGWEMQSMGPEYMLFQGGAGVGGAFFQDDNPASRVRIYISVDDIEVKLAEITAAGGIVVTPKTQISAEHGYFAMFTDPAGNLVGLWSQT